MLVETAMAQVKSQKVWAEQEGLKASEETWRRQVEQLEATLAVKEEGLKNAVQKRRIRIVMHIETLAELSSVQTAMRDSECKRAALEDLVKMKLKGKEENHERDLKEKEESVKKKMAKQNEREQEKIQQRFAEDL